jgi:hypothetical protein
MSLVIYFQLASSPFLKVGSLVKLYSHWVEKGLLKTAGWFYVGLLTTIKQLNENTSTLLVKQNYVVDTGQSACRHLSSSVRSPTNKLCELEKDLSLFWGFPYL